MEEIKRHDRVLGKLLEEKAVRNRGKPFVYFKDRMFTYDEMNERANRVGNSFLKLGVKKGDKVSIMMTNCPEYLDLWFGLAKIGAIEVPINTAFKGHILQYTLNDGEAGTLVIDQQFLDRIQFVQEELKSLKRLIIFKPKDEERPPVPSGLRFEQMDFEILRKGSTEMPPVEVRHSDFMAIMHTSGTTGPSKGVMLTYCHEMNLGWNTAFNLKMTPEDVCYIFYPYFHNTAQAIMTLAVISADAALFMRDRFSVSRFWPDVKQYRCTVGVLMGVMVKMLLSQPQKKEDADHPYRAAVTLAGTPDSYRTFSKRFNVRLMEVYGSTEANLVTYMPPEFEDSKWGSCGTVWKEFEVKIVDSDDNELPPHKVGEIVTRPKEPYIMFVGYYNKPDATAKAFRNLWFHTGDAAYFDEDGYMYFVDRLKDVIRRRGENISSYEVEVVVASHSAVQEVAVVAVPSEIGEDEVKAAVVLREGERLSPEQLTAYCEDRMPYFMVPRFIEFVKAIPKTPTEKVEKHKLRADGVNQNTWDREKAGYKLKR